MRFFFDKFSEELGRRGLALNSSKCEVVPVCRSHSVPRSLFEAFQWREDGCFKLLSAPIGTLAHCTAVTAACAAKAELFLDRLRLFDHAQGALLLLRQCGGWCKLVASTRAVPPHLRSEVFSAQTRLKLHDAGTRPLPRTALCENRTRVARGHGLCPGRRCVEIGLAVERGIANIENTLVPNGFSLY